MKHMLEVTAFTPGSKPGTAQYIFLVNLPPFGGTCSVSPFKGKLQTFFLFCM